MIETLCLQKGGLPPTHSNAPLSFYAAQACFREHRTINTTCFKHIVLAELFKTHPTGILLAHGEFRPP